MWLHETHENGCPCFHHLIGHFLSSILFLLPSYFCPCHYEFMAGLWCIPRRRMVQRQYTQTISHSYRHLKPSPPENPTSQSRPPSLKWYLPLTSLRLVSATKIHVYKGPVIFTYQFHLPENPCSEHARSSIWAMSSSGYNLHTHCITVYGEKRVGICGTQR